MRPRAGARFSLSHDFHHLNGLLNNAGLLGEVAPITKQTQAVLPLRLKVSGSSLIFSTSSAGRKGRANWGACSVYKLATEGMMQVLADEYPASMLRVKCINPGGTRNGMRPSAYPAEDADRLKTPADIMPIYLCLMVDESRRKTGISFIEQPDRKPGPATNTRAVVHGLRAASSSK